MSDFFKKFLLEDPRRLGTGGRYAALAAFGKHPGWDDHVEDLGLETESLNLAKTVFYVNGIGGQIDSGAWEKLEPAQQLPFFKHVFVWQRDGQILVGRLWSSSDGKGRKRYPLVVCAHFMGVPLGWALKHALPALAELEERCSQTTLKEDVRGVLGRKRVALREAIQSADGRGEYAPLSPEVLHRILQPPGQGQPEGFLRVLYQMQGQLGTFGPGRFNARANPAALRAQQVRVPLAGENPEQALLFWTRFFLTHVDAAVPLLLTLPLEENWLDVTVGEPESHEFFCLRATPKSVPLVSEVPYKLDASFCTKATAFLQSFQRGETARADLQPAVPLLDTPAPAKGGWFKWLALVVLVVVGGIAVIALLPEGTDKKPVAKLPQTNQAVAQVEIKKPAPAPAPVPAPIKPAATISNPPPVAAVTTPPRDSEAESLRLTEESKRLAAARETAAKLKSDAEAAVKEAERKERERQQQEAARIESEKQAALRKEVEDQRKAVAEAAAKQQADEEAKARLAATTVTNPPEAKPTVTTAALPTATRGELTNSLGMVLVPLPSGFWAGKYEVTQAEYQKVMGKNPSRSNADHQPVENVTWHDAREFCRRLTEIEKSTLPLGRIYTLPSDAQWQEFAAGQKFTDLPAGVMTRNGPAVVGLSGPNKFGMFDVLGNVAEWSLNDWTSGQKLLKGGAFKSASINRGLLPDQSLSTSGFRCVIAAP